MSARGAFYQMSYTPALFVWFLKNKRYKQVKRYLPRVVWEESGSVIWRQELSAGAAMVWVRSQCLPLVAIERGMGMFLRLLPTHSHSLTVIYLPTVIYPLTHVHPSIHSFTFTHPHPYIHSCIHILTHRHPYSNPCLSIHLPTYIHLPT